MTTRIETEATSAIVAEAAVLNRTINVASQRLALLQQELRVEALRVADREGTLEMVEFASPEGVASVCFPGPTGKFIKLAEPRLLRDEIPLRTWKLMFEERVHMTSKFMDVMETLKGAQRKAVLKVVEIVESTARVTLPK